MFEPITHTKADKSCFRNVQLDKIDPADFTGSGFEWRTFPLEQKTVSSPFDLGMEFQSFSDTFNKIRQEMKHLNHAGNALPIVN